LNISAGYAPIPPYQGPSPWCLENPVLGMDIWVQGGSCVEVLDCSFGGDYWVCLDGLVLAAMIWEEAVRCHSKEKEKNNEKRGRGQPCYDILPYCHLHLGIHPDRYYSNNDIAKFLHGSMKERS
jgi:hypothetical protein